MCHTPSYQAVSCKMHSELELAIMHSQYVKLHYSDNTAKKIIKVVKPIDIMTQKDQGEFLLCTHNNMTFKIRLDHIDYYELN